MSDIVNDILEHAEFDHHGVKGQKWGVRRRGNVKVRARLGDSEDFVISRQQKATPNRQLSTQELKRLNERLQLERTNKDLTNAGSLRKIKAGTAIATSILAVGVTANSAILFAQSPAGQAVRGAIVKGLSKR